MSDKNDKSKPKGDADSFLKLMGDTMPIKARARHQHRSPPKPKAVLRQNRERAKQETARQEDLQDHIPPDSIIDTLGDNLSFHRTQVSKRALRELRGGKLPVEGYIDLHGMTVPESIKELRLFIRYCDERNLRCVRIVTGKGLRSAEGPKIRPNVMGWLQQSDAVLAYTPALQQHGGSGALYVLLR